MGIEHSKPFGRFTFIATAMSLAVTPFAPDAHANTEEAPQLSGENVVYYDYDYQLLRASREIMTGTPLAGRGCLFGGEESLGLNGRDAIVLRTREIAFNPMTCEWLLETGELPRPLAEDVLERAIVPNGSDLSGQETESAGDASDVGVLTHATYQSWQRLWYEEPAQQSVGEVTNRVTWTPDATCASPTGGQDTAGYRLDWLEQTGWRLINHNWTNGFSCQRVFSQSSVHYKNQIFCLTVDTDVFFDLSLTEGLSGENGQTRWEWSARKFGGCSALLGFHRDRAVARL